MFVFCSGMASAIAFGAYTQSVVNQSGTITVLCTNGTAYNVGLDAGTGTGASVKPLLKTASPA